MKPQHILGAAGLAAVCAWLLVACGGGGSSSTSSAGAPATASGVLSAFGSVVVNGHEYATGASTSVVDGDNDDAASALANLQVGMTVDVDADASGTNATKVRFASAVRGEVDAVDTTNNVITVLGQAVQITSATTFAGSKTSGSTSTTVSALSNVAVGDYVQVYGFFQCTSASTSPCTAADVVATLVYEPGTSGMYRVEGYIQNLASDGSSFAVNGLTVDVSTSGSGATACVPAPCALSNGLFVAVRSDSAPTGSGSGLALAATKVRTITQAPVLAVGSTVTIEGPVSNFSASPFTFTVRGVQVTYTPPSGVTVVDLVDGQIVEVTGTVAADGSISASSFTVERSANLMVTAPMDSASATADTVALLGQTFTVNSDTRFADRAQNVRPFNLSNFATVLAAGDQLIVSGYTATTSSSSGGTTSLVATRVERIPTPTTPLVGVEGVVSADTPGASSGTLTIGGVTVNLAASTVVRYPGSGLAGGTLTGFFGAVTAGTTVAEATGTAGSTAGTMTAVQAAAFSSTCQWVFGPH